MKTDHKWLNFSLSIIPAIFLLLCGTARSETTYALLIGINNYRYETNLKGSVNDANDIEQALKQAGIKRIRKLLNAQASRDRIEKEWLKIIKQARPGDRIIFTYAGHGSQIKDVNGDEVKHDSADTSDETFLLSGYRSTSENTHREQLLDDELGRWFNQAVDKGLNILFVADSCHSGDSFRSLSGTGRSVPINQNSLPVLQDALKLSANELADTNRFMFISANPSSEKIQELRRTDPITKRLEHRGALSIAFADAIRHADFNNDGALNVNEIRSHVEALVKKESGKTQRPTFYPGQGNNIVFRAKQKVPAHQPPLVQRKQVLVKVEGSVPRYARNLANLQLVNDGYELRWNSRNGRVYNRTNDLTATGITDQDSLGKVLSRKLLVDQLYDLGKQPGRFVQATLGNTENRTHRFKDKVNFNVKDFQFPYLYQFNIAGNGDTQCFKAEPVPMKTGVNYSFTVQQPEGNDTLISIAVPKASTTLDKLIGSEQNCTDVLTLSRQLPKLLKKQAFQVSHVDMFSIAR